jgi:hypothetical protein
VSDDVLRVFLHACNRRRVFNMLNIFRTRDDFQHFLQMCAQQSSLAQHKQTKQCYANTHAYYLSLTKQNGSEWTPLKNVCMCMRQSSWNLPCERGVKNTAEKRLRIRHPYWNLSCERGDKCSDSDFRRLSKTQNGRDFDVFPFLWKCKRNNECDNLKTRNNYILHVHFIPKNIKILKN